MCSGSHVGGASGGEVRLQTITFFARISHHRKSSFRRACKRLTFPAASASRRMGLKFLLAFVLITRTFQPAARPEQSVMIEVPATSPWTDTGIVVNAGDRIEIRAWGAVKYDLSSPNALVGPSGSGRSDGACEYVVTDAHVAAHSLVANVSRDLTFDGRGFYIGTTWKGTVPFAGTSAPVGRLFVGFNDRGVLCDRSGYDSWKFRNANSGGFTAVVTVTRAR